ncbi:MAG TPA: FAD-dependent oxidoreductase [Polyangiaceae bacterium]
MRQLCVQLAAVQYLTFGAGTQLVGLALVSSAPETVLRLLGGRYAADELTSRLERWKQFNPIVLVSFGVSTPLAEVPASLLIDGIEPLWIGNYANERLYLRIYNDDPGFAPPGHTVVQALLNTDYEWWATRGSDYNSAKDQIAGLVLNRLERELPALIGAVRTVDVSTPLTYWNMARSWHGAYEGWLPSVDAMLHHVSKQLPGLAGFYMAGQWVEPGGGVPMAIMSGRQVVQLLCKSEGRVFEPSKR